MNDDQGLMPHPVVAITGSDRPGVRAAVAQGGGVPGPVEQADALIHLGGPAGMPALPDRVRWVQLPGAGIEAYLAGGVIDRRRVWTSAVGAYAGTVAEHAVALLLSGVRGLVTATRLDRWQPDLVVPRVTGIAGTNVAVIGAGGIGRRVIELLAPFGAAVTAVNRSGRPVSGTVRTVPADRVAEVWQHTDHIVLGAPATDATRGLIDAAVLSSLKPASWIVNVARGSLVETGALIDAVRAGRIAGAALDVTDPEPLPPDHALWTTPGILITPHTANPAHHMDAALDRRVAENVARFAAGRELLGVVDVDAGY